MIKKIALVVAGLMVSGVSLAADQSQLLREKLQQFDRFHAKFTQHVYDRKGALLQESTGEMDVLQPNKFRWQTQEPDESLIVSDGNKVWLYNPDLESVTAMSLDKTVEQSPLWLIVNQTPTAWQNFEVTAKVTAPVAKASAAKTKPSAKAAVADLFVITPKDPQSLTRKIEIQFKGEEISKLTIEDRQGQYSHFQLSGFDSLSAPAADLFQFVVPEGIEVDEQF